jgi:hypothetical protein
VRNGLRKSGPLKGSKIGIVSGGLEGVVSCDTAGEAIMIKTAAASLRGLPGCGPRQPELLSILEFL